MSRRPEDRSEWWEHVPHQEVAGTGFAWNAELLLTDAVDVRQVIERTYLGVTGPGANQALREIGRRVAESEKARSRLAGYLFEHLDCGRYNLRQMSEPAAWRRLMKLCEGPTFPGYDAFRTGGGKVAEGIQQKLCELNIRPAIDRMESWWPGSARATVFRVPSDVADRAQLLAGQRCQVEASEFAKADIYKRLDRGSDQLARNGTLATSRAFQAAKAGAKSGAVAAVVGGAFDAPKLKRREMSGKHFLARRGMDAAEGATTAMATSGLVGATTSIAAYVVAVGGTGAGTAATVLTAPAWVLPVVGGLAVGTGVRFVTKRVRRRLDEHFTSENADEALEATDAESPLVADLDAYRPRPWIPAAAAALLVVPTLSLWTPKPFTLWTP